MAIPNSFPAVSAPPPRMVGRFVALQAILILLAAPMLGAAVARGAVSIQNFRAPLVIFPLLVGCCLGLLLAGLIRLAQVGHRATIWGGAIVAVAAAVAGQHYFSFRDWKAAETAQRTQGRSLAELLVVQEMKPEESTDFSQFMQRQATMGRPVTAAFSLRGPAAWASWAADGLLTLIAAGTIIFLACRGPYCSSCRTWYRMVRAGSLSGEQARQIGEAASLHVEGQAGDARYRLSQCMGGCGPSRLEMSCGGQEQTRVLEAWLSPAQREQVMRELDGKNPGAGAI